MLNHVVQDSVVNEVVSFLETRAKLEFPTKQDARIQRVLVGAGYDLQAGDAEKLAVDMFNLNVAAVNQQYKGDVAGQFRNLDFQYCYEVPKSAIETMRTLDYLTDQSWDDDMQITGLYQAMTIIIHAIWLMVYETPRESMDKEVTAQDLLLAKSAAGIK